MKTEHRLHFTITLTPKQTIISSVNCELPGPGVVRLLQGIELDVPAAPTHLKPELRGTWADKVIPIYDEALLVLRSGRLHLRGGVYDAQFPLAKVPALICPPWAIDWKTLAPQPQGLVINEQLAGAGEMKLVIDNPDILLGITEPWTFTGSIVVQMETAVQQDFTQPLPQVYAQPKHQPFKMSELTVDPNTKYPPMTHSHAPAGDQTKTSARSCCGVYFIHAKDGEPSRQNWLEHGICLFLHDQCPGAPVTMAAFGVMHERRSNAAIVENSGFTVQAYETLGTGPMLMVVQHKDAAFPTWTLRDRDPRCQMTPTVYNLLGCLLRVLPEHVEDFAGLREAVKRELDFTILVRTPKDN